MKPLLGCLSWTVIVLATAGCRVNDRDPAVTELLNEKVYTRVGMHFETKRGRYVTDSSNYISLPHYTPPGTALTLKKVSSKVIELVDDNGSEFQVRYIPQISKVQMAAWRKRHFSSQLVDLPKDLTDHERTAIALGEVRPGMSRTAVFLAVGYPPTANNTSSQTKTLTYELRRSLPYSIRFDEKDRVDKIGRRR